MKHRMKKRFLEAILENPDDDTARLVYADWLEEHGDSARAEFIRVQCRMGRLPRWHREWPLLSWRQSVLLARYEHVWRSELPDIDDVQWGAFKRGFVNEVVVIDAGVLPAREEAICRSAPVRSAAVAGCRSWLDCPPVSFLTELRILADDFENGSFSMFLSPLLSNLKKLDLSDVSLEGEQFAVLAQAPPLGKLETLILDGCYMGDGNLRPLAESAWFRNLRTLSMKGNAGGYQEDARIRPNDVALLADSPNLTRLESLNLADNEIDGASLRRLLGSKYLANLRELNVTHNNLTAKEVKWLDEVDTKMRLHSLALANNPIGDAGAAALALAPYCKQLVDLDLAACEITAKGVRELAEARWFGKLGRLNLNQNSAAADGVHALTKGARSGALYSLHLSDNELDAEAVKMLADSPALSGVHTFDLSENALDAETLQTLADSPYLTELRDLQLARCNLDGASVARLRSAPWLANLVQFSLSDNPIGDAALSTLLAGGALTRVHRLRLHSCGLWAPTAQALADAGLTELHWLDLSGNGLDGGGTEVLARSPLSANLVDLDLSGNTIGDKGVISIAACSWPLLRRLGLQSIHMTNTGVLALADSQTMPRVQEVQCRSNSIGWETFRKVGPRFRQW
jgi:uncharacterized protein (TIGR02996 family)